MCTLIAGLGVLGPGTLLVGANRDESPERPSLDPGILSEDPRVVGGRDLVAGGTWLAVRDARRVTALMNRRPAAADRRDPATFRSRGLLCLETAALPLPPRTTRRATPQPALHLQGNGPPAPRAGEDRSPEGLSAGGAEPATDSWLEAALELVARAPYGECTLVGLSAEGGGWALHAGLRPPAATSLAPGWHVITHLDVDDAGEPRTQWLMERLSGERPADPGSAIELLQALLRQHGEDGEPPVCLHRDVFPTVSSTILSLGIPAPRYLHASGPPCVTPYGDRSELLRAGAGAR